MAQDWQEIFSYKLKKVRSVFAIDKILNVPTHPKAVAEYYRINKIPYSIIYRGNDFIHLGLTPKGQKLNKRDVLGPVKIVEDYINIDTKNVLELATGRGANSFYLANKYPGIEFTGLDLPDGQISFAQKKARMLRNFNVIEGDFHDLSYFAQESFDLVFIIESLCYSENKLKVLGEARRVLKPGGIFIVIDACTKNGRLNENEMLVKRLVERGMGSADFPREENFASMIKNAEFKISKTIDLSEEALPSSIKIQKTASFFFSFPTWLQSLFIKIFPPRFSYNSVSGYFGADTIEAGIFKYFGFILKK